MASSIDFRRESLIIYNAINDSQAVLKNENEVSVDKLVNVYDSIENALIGCENLKRNGHYEASNWANLASKGLETSLLITTILLCKNNNVRYKEKFVNSPWGKKISNPDYFKEFVKEEYVASFCPDVYQMIFGEAFVSK